MQRWRILAWIVALPLLLAACGAEGDGGVATLGGGSGDRTGASPSVDPEDALVAWAECMREHGIDVPDPQVGEDGQVEIQVGAPSGGRSELDPDELGAATQACEDLMPEGGPLGGGELSAEERAEMEDRLLEWARCMREHGIDVPDPTFAADGGSLVRIGDGSDAIDPSDPEFRAAEEACGQPFDAVEGEAP